jgi:AhpD family alkylhydroperoxidase
MKPRKERSILLIDSKIEELIAIGTAVGVHCEPCLDFYVREARELGISEEEIIDAMKIGKQLERSAISNMQKKIDKFQLILKSKIGDKK